MRSIFRPFPIAVALVAGALAAATVFGLQDAQAGSPVNGTPGNGAASNGAPLNGAPINGLPNNRLPNSQPSIKGIAPSSPCPAGSSAMNCGALQNGRGLTLPIRIGH